MICALSVENKNIYFSTGLKLIGDLIGKTKDEIKTAAKRGTKKDTYMFFYLNYVDFELQRKEVSRKLEFGKNRGPCDPINNYYKPFIKYSKYILKFLKTEGKYNPEGFNTYFLTQDDKKGHVLRPVEEFLEMYKDFYLKIYN